MPLLSKGWSSIRRTRKEPGGDGCWVRAIPGAIPGSPLECWVQEVLAGHPTCPLTQLVSEVAEYLRRSERPSLLASLDEGLWGGWVWPALAREELRRLDGIVIGVVEGR